MRRGVKLRSACALGGAACAMLNCRDLNSSPQSRILWPTYPTSFDKKKPLLKWRRGELFGEGNATAARPADADDGPYYRRNPLMAAATQRPHHARIRTFHGLTVVL